MRTVVSDTGNFLVENLSSDLSEWTYFVLEGSGSKDVVWTLVLHKDGLAWDNGVETVGPFPNVRCAIQHMVDVDSYDEIVMVMKEELTKFLSRGEG